MNDLIRALTILKHYLEDENARNPLNCTHDELWIMEVDPENVAEADMAELESLGFFVDDDAFKSHRFGSA